MMRRVVLRGERVRGHERRARWCKRGGVGCVRCKEESPLRAGG